MYRVSYSFQPGEPVHAFGISGAYSQLDSEFRLPLSVFCRSFPLIVQLFVGLMNAGKTMEWPFELLISCLNSKPSPLPNIPTYGWDWGTAPLDPSRRTVR